ncbi:MAG: sugar phosphate isomerase/epimerase [Ruminococcaceae bacterium]|nr:sugar phosphate isomerase/epimerase [Oscillospiraceae bacterium]
MKVCVTSYSFHRLLKSGELNQLTAMRKAKEMGFDAMEFSGILPQDNMSKSEYAKILRTEADKLNFPIVSFVFSADLANGTEGRTVEEEVTYVKEMIDIGEILGVKSVRHDAISKLGKYKSFDAALPDIAKRISEISEYAKTKGIKTSVENHGYICQDPERVERLYNAVESDNFGLLCDIGNFLCADADPERAVSIVAPYAIFVHAKDFYIKKGDGANPGGHIMTRGGKYIKATIVGHGDVPIKQCIKSLMRAGYDGYVSLEFEGMEDNYTALKMGLDNLRRFISEAKFELGK